MRGLAFAELLAEQATLKKENSQAPFDFAQDRPSQARGDGGGKVCIRQAFRHFWLNRTPLFRAVCRFGDKRAVSHSISGH